MVTASCDNLTKSKVKIGNLQPTISQKAIETIVRKYKPYIKDDPSKVKVAALGSAHGKEPSSGNNTASKPST